MVGGQVVDVISAGQKVTSKKLEYIHQKKTGQLITFSARAGAILADADKESLDNITIFADYLGLAFQITDDILDVVGEPEVMGKPRGSDQMMDKITFPRVYGLEKSKKLAKESAEKAISYLKKIPRETDDLENLTYFVIEREK